MICLQSLFSIYAGIDYVPLMSYELIYQPNGNNTQCVQLQIVNGDNLLEGAEWLIATLSATDNHIKFQDSSTNITILDNRKQNKGRVTSSHTP